VVQEGCCAYQYGKLFPESKACDQLVIRPIVRVLDANSARDVTQGCDHLQTCTCMQFCVAFLIIYRGILALSLQPTCSYDVVAIQL
jgi:hypothetical protein